MKVTLKIKDAGADVDSNSSAWTFVLSLHPVSSPFSVHALLRITYKPEMEEFPGSLMLILIFELSGTYIY